MVRMAMMCMLVSILCSCGGGGAKTVVHQRLTTIGQEMTDLKAARESGAISQSEYEQQRQKLLSGE